uniref:Uncharacterized protein n=1 Tax=Glossina palpalis gambiensis TaxID=67801 RepID=A0A1B0AUN6_9MUSC
MFGWRVRYYTIDYLSRCSANTKYDKTRLNCQVILYNFTWYGNLLSISFAWDVRNFMFNFSKFNNAMILLDLLSYKKILGGKEDEEDKVEAELDSILGESCSAVTCCNVLDDGVQMRSGLFVAQTESVRVCVHGLSDDEQANKETISLRRSPTPLLHPGSWNIWTCTYVKLKGRATRSAQVSQSQGNLKMNGESARMRFYGISKVHENIKMDSRSVQL